MKSEFTATIGQWVYLDCETLVKFPQRSGVYVTGPQCDACGNTNLRFIHTLQHESTNRQVLVGIECAQLLVDREDWKIPRLAENETKRKERWRRDVFHKPGRCVTTVNDLINRGKL